MTACDHTWEPIGDGVSRCTKCPAMLGPAKPIGRVGKKTASRPAAPRNNRWRRAR
jgi:hypothetical protein